MLTKFLKYNLGILINFFVIKGTWQRESNGQSMQLAVRPAVGQHNRTSQAGQFPRHHRIVWAISSRLEFVVSIGRAGNSAFTRLIRNQNEFLTNSSPIYIICNRRMGLVTEWAATNARGSIIAARSSVLLRLQVYCEQSWLQVCGASSSRHESGLRRFVMPLPAHICLVAWCCKFYKKNFIHLKKKIILSYKS